MDVKDIGIFRQAILNEVEGYEFYKLAAYNVENDETKKLLIQMSNEERDHLDWLKDVFGKLGGVEEDRKTLMMLNAPESPQIFNWENVSVKSPSLGVSVIGMAMAFERKSVEFYEKAYEDTKDPVAKQVFHILIEWEKGHLEQFSRAYEAYSKAWWADQNFHPF